MKFQVTMKDPGTLHDAIKDAVRGDVAALPLSEDERDAVFDLRRDAVAEICGIWFSYGEYLTVEIDTEARTCTVVPDP